MSGQTAYVSARSAVLRFDLAAGRQLEGLNESLGLATKYVGRTIVDAEGSLWIGAWARLIQVPT